MRPIDKLPDCYKKSDDSNNSKLLNLHASSTKELRQDIEAVSAVLDLNKATGKTLDLYGSMLQQQRGLLNDEQYRYMLLARIGRNVVQGDYNSIMRTLVLMFNTEQGNITLDDLELEEASQGCAVRLTRFPVYVLVNAGFSSKQAVMMIENLLPVCVTLAADNFEGTFEFAEYEDEYNGQAGFGNIEQTIGGYLGLYIGDDDTIPELPL